MKEVSGSGGVVHSVVRADGHGKVRVVHRNMIMPCSDALAKELLQEIATTKNGNSTQVQQKISKTSEKSSI